MAVEDKYVEANVALGKKTSSAYNSGAQPQCIVGTFEVAAADSDGSVYRIAKALNPEMIPLSLTIMCDAITAGTDWDVGFYKTNLGAVVDKDNLADALDLSSASKTLDGLKDVNIDSRHKRLFELAGHTSSTKLSAYDLALTANTVGSAAGTVSFILWYVQG